MARLRIVIEGEMTPEEMRSYIAAAWGNPLPRDKAEMTVEMGEADVAATRDVIPLDVEEAPVVAPPAPPAPDSGASAPAPNAMQLSEAQVVELAGVGKLSAIIAAIQELGLTDPQEVLAEVVRIKGAIPGLARLSEDALADRIPRVLEMMR